jgi:hypothetical protein
MRTTIIFLFVLTICPAINSDDLIGELQQDIIRREFFQLVETTTIQPQFISSVSPGNDLPYSRGTVIGNEEFNMIYYGYQWADSFDWRRPDRNERSVIELFGQRFSFLGGVMWQGYFFLFEHNGKSYFLWADSREGWNDAWLSFYFLFDITDRNRVKALNFVNVTFESDIAHIGLFPDKDGVLCTIITFYDSSMRGASYRTRLYAISDRGLDEVLDNNGRNIELYYNWSKWEHWNVEIVYRNIPQDLNVSEFSFRTAYFFNEQGAID